LEELSARELCAAIDDELAQLPERYRAPLIICCLEGRSRDEAARHLGVSAGTIKGRLERGRERLRQRLARRGVPLPAAFAAVWLAAGTGALADAAVVSATARAAVAFVTGDETVAVSARATQLAQMGLQVTAIGPLRLVTAGLLLSSVLGTGVGFMALSTAPKPADDLGQPAANIVAPVRTDLYGDPLPPGVQARLGTVRFRHGGYLVRMVASPDGTQLITAGTGGIRFWDVATGRLVRSIPLNWYITDIALLADGKRLASIEFTNGPTDGKTTSDIRIWDLATGAELFRFETLPDIQRLLAVSPDGKLLATCGSKGPIRLWNVATGAVIRQIGNANGQNNSLRFSADGSTILVAGSGQISLLDVTTGQDSTPASWFTSRRDMMQSRYFAEAALSPDARWVATNGKGYDTPDGEHRVELLLFDRTGGPPRTLPGQWSIAYGLAFTPDGRDLISSGNAGTLARWDLATGRPKWEVDGPPDTARSILFLPDGKLLATAGYDGVARLWDAATGTPVKQEREAHGAEITQVGYSPDGRWVVTVGSDCTLRVWDSKTARQQRKLYAPDYNYDRNYNLFAFAFSPDGRVLATLDEPNTVRLLELNSDKEPRPLDTAEGKGRIVALFFSTDGRRLFALTESYQLHAWDVASGRFEKTFTPTDLPADANLPGIRWTYKGRGVYLSPRTSGQVLLPLLFPINELGLLDLEGQPSVRRIPGAPLRPSVLLPDGRHLIHVADRALHVREIATGRERYAFPVRDLGECQMAATADGRMIGVANISSNRPSPFQLIELASGQDVRSFDYANAPLTGFDFSPDGRHFVAGYRDTTALIWDLATPPTPGTPLDQLWVDLVGEAPTAYAAVWGLALDAGRTVPFLRERLKPAVAADPATVQRLINDLDDNRFPVREAADREMRKLGSVTDLALRDALTKPRSLELRLRIEALLNAPRFPPSAEELRQVRAVQALEYANDSVARELLRSLAGGAEGARLTREARDALQRLERDNQ
jgi:WD40 repeat protein